MYGVFTCMGNTRESFPGTVDQLRAVGYPITPRVYPRTYNPGSKMLKVDGTTPSEALGVAATHRLRFDVLARSFPMVNEI